MATPWRMRTRTASVNIGDIDFRRRIERFLKGALWEAVLGTLSAASFVLLIVEADYGSAGPPNWVRASVLGFSAFYAAELAVRLFASRRRFFLSKLNVLDTALVVVDLVSVLLESLSVELVVSTGALRGVRALRLSRTLQASGKWPHLQLMSRGLLNAVGAAFFGAGLMLAVLAIFSAVAVQVIHPINLKVVETGAYHNCPRCPHAFESVRSSLLTFFQMYVVGDSWGILMLPIMEEAPATSLFFCVVFVCVHFAIMNVIMAVIVDIALKASQEDLAERVRAKEREWVDAADELRELCKEMDTDGSGDLTEDEIMGGFEGNTSFREQLMAMDVKREDMHVVFSIMDADHSGTVNYEEFISELYKMKQFDSHTLLLFIKHYVTEIHRDVHLQRDALHRAEERAPTRSSTRSSQPAPEPARRVSGREALPLVAKPELLDLDAELERLGRFLAQEIQASVKDLVQGRLLQPSPGEDPTPKGVLSKVEPWPEAAPRTRSPPILVTKVGQDAGSCWAGRCCQAPALPVAPAL